MCVQDTRAALLLVELCQAESISRVVWPGKERPLGAAGRATAARQESWVPDPCVLEPAGGSARTTSLNSPW